MKLEVILDILQIILIIVGLTMCIGVSVLIALDHRKFDRYWKGIIRSKRGGK